MRITRQKIPEKRYTGHLCRVTKKRLLVFGLDVVHILLRTFSTDIDGHLIQKLLLPKANECNAKITSPKTRFGQDRGKVTSCVDQVLCGRARNAFQICKRPAFRLAGDEFIWDHFKLLSLRTALFSRTKFLSLLALHYLSVFLIFNFFAFYFLISEKAISCGQAVFSFMSADSTKRFRT